MKSLVTLEIRLLHEGDNLEFFSSLMIPQTEFIFERDLSVILQRLVSVVTLSSLLLRTIRVEHFMFNLMIILFQKA